MRPIDPASGREQTVYYDVGVGSLSKFPGASNRMLSTADNGFSYSINQSAKEALYVPTSDAEKYRAKAFIDMFVQRFAKAIAVLISLGITFAVTDMSSLRYLSLVTLALLVVWIVAARYAGRQFANLEQSKD